MSGTNVTVASKTGVSTLVRARFGPGMLLHHEDLEQLNAYTRELSRLMFRSLFGCGVICGLVVKTGTKCGKAAVTVEPGLALDGCGDPIYVPKGLSLAVDQECDPNLKGPLWIVLCGTAKSCAPRTSICASDEDEAPSVCTRERDGFEIRLVRERPQCTCGCPEPKDAVAHSEGETTRSRETGCTCVDPNDPCYAAHYEGKCACTCDDCAECGCRCVLLARLDKTKDEMHPWKADHRVRRFIRPVLMRDPQVEAEKTPRKDLHEEMQMVAEIDVLKKAPPKSSKAKRS